MKQGKELNIDSSQQKLHQTTLSINLIDKSYQRSMIISNSLNKNKIIPLHSHYIYKNNSSLVKINNSQNNFNTPFRLLDSNCKNSQINQVNNFQSLNKVSKIRKKGFNSSQQRKLKIFQGAKTIQQTKKTNLICILHNNIKQKVNNNMIKEQKEITSPPESFKKPNQPKIGFRSSQKLQRIQQKIYKKGCPGPGHYQIHQIQLLKTVKNKNSGKKSRLKKYQLLSSNSTQQIGPGSYFNELTFQNQRKIITQKQKRRQIYVDKKNKIKNLLQRLNFQIRQRKISNQNQKFGKNSDKIDRYSESQQQNLNKKKEKVKNLEKTQKRKLIRNQLKDKTNNFLPKVDEIAFSGQETFNYQPSYKYIFSNSFVSKNDHAYQAHFYKPKQKQSQYIFLQAKRQVKKFGGQSPFFKSNSIRQLF